MESKKQQHCVMSDVVLMNRIVMLQTFAVSHKYVDSALVAAKYLSVTVSCALIRIVVVMYSLQLTTYS